MRVSEIRVIQIRVNQGLSVLPTTYILQQFAKISIFKIDNFVLRIFLLPKLRSVAQIEWKKHPYY